MPNPIWIFIVGVLVALAFWKLSKYKWKGLPIMSIQKRLLLSLLFPLFLALFVFLGSLIAIIVLGILFLGFILFIIFSLFGNKKTLVIRIK